MQRWRRVLLRVAARARQESDAQYSREREERRQPRAMMMSGGAVFIDYEREMLRVMAYVLKDV